MLRGYTPGQIERSPDDITYWKGRYCWFHDEGLIPLKGIRGKGKTRKYMIHERISHSKVGEIRWAKHVHEYAVCIYQDIVQTDMLREICEFADNATQAHKARIPPPKPKKRIIKPSPFARTISRVPR